MENLTLPCITSVQFIESKDLELFPKQILSPGDTISPIGYFAALKLCEPASLTTTSEMTNAGLVYTTRITGNLFDSNDNALTHRLSSGLFNFKIQDSHRKSYLLGAKEKPLPQIIFGKSIESTNDGRRVSPFEITWVSTLPPIEIVLL